MIDNIKLFSDDIEHQTGKKIRHINYIGCFNDMNIFYVVLDDGTKAEWCCTRYDEYRYDKRVNTYAECYKFNDIDAIKTKATEVSKHG